MKQIPALDGKTVGYSLNDVVFVGFILDSATNISFQRVYRPVGVCHVSRYSRVTYFLAFPGAIHQE